MSDDSKNVIKKTADDRLYTYGDYLNWSGLSNDPSTFSPTSEDFSRID